MPQNYANFSSHKIVISEFNFQEYRKGVLKTLDRKESRFVKQYYDNENVVLLTIFESGWKNHYNCVLEWGEYQDVDYKLYTAQEIYEYYKIKNYLRKEKLEKINLL
jgi:hypothetical protein